METILMLKQLCIL